ncbi:LacI family DNA-binding transcriptional regulator [Halomonas sp. CUBES01]|uniref:LacI family DNA-binding transcriptional regulator n=1 Tax=Vreelandella gomseomensis TaxID=370766 RepID=A0ABU1G8K9_9GAMM|nr:MULTISPECIES: LacI family DNA-binding transcriptional regulator [Halomonas]MDR5873827.1 LacI family DNA-binding transcriptional regulator [Halomonas gomseomensis]MEC4766903.1 LacI family DNA-binding transcriptional regulator [Halomonas sp. CUBES01]
MPSPPTRATLIEVAKRAGTSKSSVSRFFGPERDKLSQSLQQRVAEAAAALGYQPNQMARGLKGGGSRLLGMMVADIRNPFSVAVMHGVEIACRDFGYSLIVCNTDNDPALEQHHLATLAAYQVEGLIINAVGQSGQTLLDSGVPRVLLDRDIKHLNAEVIGLDNALAIDMALAHLAQQGYRSILYVSETPEHTSTRQARLERFQQQADAMGFTHQTLMLSHWDIDAPCANLATFVEPYAPGHCAVLCANGNATLAMARCFKRLGVAMGPVGLMGIDELEWCELMTPGITTLAQPTDSIGRDAVACLVNQLERRATPLTFHSRHSPQLLVRGSTAP